MAKSFTITAPDALFAQAVEAVCANYGYQPNVPDPANPGGTVPNPESPVEFAMTRLKLWLRDNIEAHVVRQANAAVDAERAKVQQQLDAAADLIQTTVE